MTDDADDRDADTDHVAAPSVEAIELARERGEVGDGLLERELAARPFDALAADGSRRRSRPRHRRSSRPRSRAQAPSVGRRWALPPPMAGRACPASVEPTSDDQAGGGKLADQGANGAPRQSGPRAELGARQGTGVVQFAGDGAQVCATDGFAAQARFIATLIQRL